jgi:TP53 regulating kinase-like protein
MTKTIGRGAEAIISLENNEVLKDRIKKSYRLPLIDDKLRKSRTKREAKILKKISSLIPVPTVLSTDNKEKIKMQFIKGKKLSEHLDTLKNAEKICEEIGSSIAILHDNDIIHGDLTTSNLIYNKKVFFIDFGLSFHSHRIEDKAVDLHLLRQALEAKHFQKWEQFFSAVLKGYQTKDKTKILLQLKKVESRGRYKKGF